MKKLTNLLMSMVLCILVVVTVDAKVYRNDNLEIVYDNQIDLNLAIPNVEKARKFFRDLGYKADYPVKLIFQEAVYLDIPILDSDRVIKQRIYAGYFGNMFDGEKNVIKVSSWGTDYLRSRDCFNISITRRLHSTIITHETAHLLLRSIAGRLGHGVNEYIAYTVQITTMDKDLQDKLLNAYKDTEPFNEEIMINAMFHANNPHQFGIKSYLHFKTNGTSTFRKIVDDELDPDAIMDALYGDGTTYQETSK